MYRVLKLNESEELDKKLNDIFAGKVVRKDLTKKIKEGANVPVYVLEYLLGMYCATDDDQAIKDGVERVKKILADNFKPDFPRRYACVSCIHTRLKLQMGVCCGMVAACRNDGSYRIFADKKA